MNSSLRTNLRIIGIAAAIIFLIITDIADAQGIRRRTRRRTAVVVAVAVHESDQQNSKTTEQDTPPDTTKEVTPPPAPPAPETTGGPLPVGTVVSKLPEGCVSTQVDNVQYYNCGENYYRAAYEENNLVYVTTEPPG